MSLLPVILILEDAGVHVGVFDCGDV